MKSIALFTFSGTGTTYLVADMLKKGFEGAGHTVDAFHIEDIRKQKTTVDYAAYDMIGIGSCILGFTAPTIVYDFVRSLPQGNGMKVFIYRSAGGVAPMNFNASKGIIRILEHKGYVVEYERIFAIAANWMVKFDDQVVLRLHAATQKKTVQMCGEVLAGKARLYPVSFVNKVLFGFIGTMSRFGLRMIGTDYKVTDDCTLCGMCVRNCPVENIYEKNGKIKFKFDCMSCMRCIYACPENAIQPRLFKAFPVEGGFDIKQTLALPMEPDMPDTSSLPHLKSYLENE